MKAAIDAVSLIFILKIDKLKDMTTNYFDRLYVTNEVYEEVFEGKISEEVQTLDRLKPSFERKNPKKNTRNRKLLFRIPKR